MWISDHGTTFTSVKVALLEPPVLAKFDFSRETTTHQSPLVTILDAVENPKLQRLKEQLSQFCFSLPNGGKGVIMPSRTRCVAPWYTTWGRRIKPLIRKYNPSRTCWSFDKTWPCSAAAAKRRNRGPRTPENICQTPCSMTYGPWLRQMRFILHSSQLYQTAFLLLGTTQHSVSAVIVLYASSCPLTTVSCYSAKESPSPDRPAMTCFINYTQRIKG